MRNVAAEERRGIIRWLRLEFQRAAFATQTGFGLDIPADGAAADGRGRIRQTWPSGLSERVRAVRETLAAEPAPAAAETIARNFNRARTADVREILETLVFLGQARRVEDKFVL
jgi:hypothetical protein